MNNNYDWLYNIFNDSFCNSLNCSECPCYRKCRSTRSLKCSEVWKSWLKEKLEPKEEKHVK